MKDQVCNMPQTEETNILNSNSKTPINTPFLIGHENAEKELFEP